MALVSHKYKFIYLKTFKTASSSTYQFFSKYCAEPGASIEIMGSETPCVSEWGIVGTHYECRNVNNWGAHINAKEVKDALGEEVFDNYYKFTTVRNPFQTAVSAFRHNYPDADHGRFDKFITEEYDSEENWDIYTLDGVPVCDSYIRYESLIEGVNGVLQTLKMGNPITAKDFPRLRVMAGQSRAYKAFYTKDISFYANKVCKKELDFFDYKL